MDFPSLEPKEVLESYVGDYELSGMVWEGDENRLFDLNGDGNQGDVESELLGLENIKNNWDAFLHNIALYKTQEYDDGSIAMRFDGVIPIQGYYFDSGKVVNCHGDKWLFNFKFTIDAEGKVCPDTDSYSRPSSTPSDKTIENDSLNLTLMSYEPGKIVIKVEHTLYDFLVPGLVEGAILTTYSLRVSQQ